MKKLGKVIQWFVGIVTILSGVLMLSESVLGGALWVLGGLLVLPPVTPKIPQFRGRGAVLVIGYLFLFLAGSFIMPTTESGEQPVQTASDEADLPDAPPAEEAPDATAEPAADPQDDAGEFGKKEAKELKEWILGAVSSTGDITATDKEFKKWGKFEEDDFLPVWESAVLECVKEESKNIDSTDSFGGMECFDSMTGYLESASALYENIYGDSEEISEVRELSESLSEQVAENKALQEKYPFDLCTAAPSRGIFYISHKLETSYSDNILGALEKEIDSYQEEESSDWVANDVKYIGDEAYGGDERYVIHANNVSPFPRQDAYSIYYTDTGKTVELVDGLGFRNEVPIYQMIEGGDVEMDRQRYTDNLDGCCYDLEAIKYALSKKAYRKLKREDEDILEDISGIYFIEKDSGSCFNFSLDYKSEYPLSAGWVDYIKDGYGQYEGGALYEIDENVYAARTERNTTYVFGFFKKGKKIKMDVYCNGEHQGEVPRTAFEDYDAM